MSDIFISYTKESMYKAELLAKMLEKDGFSVFWDRHMLLGPSWEQVIEDSLREARCVVVLWSGASAKRKWVQKEAANGAQREILVPVRTGRAKAPPDFEHLETADLAGWEGDGDDPEFKKFVSAVKAKVDDSGTQGESESEADDPQSDGREESPAAALASPAAGTAFEAEVSEVVSVVDRQQSAAAEPAAEGTAFDTDVSEVVSVVEKKQSIAAAPPAAGRGSGWIVKTLVAVVGIALAVWLAVRSSTTTMNEREPVREQVSAPIDAPVPDEPVYQQPEAVDGPPRGPAHASEYYEHENGAFQFEGEEWGEYSWDPAAASFTYEETGRDADWIYLHDASREVDVALPTGEGHMLIREPGDTDWQEHYYLTIPE